MPRLFRRAVIFLALAFAPIFNGCNPPAFAQDAAVIQLNQADAQLAQELHREQLALNARWEELRQRIARNYLEASVGQNAGCVAFQMLIRPEWGCAEFTYSANFRFIVPAANLSKAPYDGELFQLVNGIPTAIKEKSEWELDQESGKFTWVWNNTPNSETNPPKP